MGDAQEIARELLTENTVEPTDKPPPVAKPSFSGSSADAYRAALKDVVSVEGKPLPSPNISTQLPLSRSRTQDEPRDDTAKQQQRTAKMSRSNTTNSKPDKKPGRHFDVIDSWDVTAVTGSACELSVSLWRLLYAFLFRVEADWVLYSVASRQPVRRSIAFAQQSQQSSSQGVRRADVGRVPTREASGDGRGARKPPAPREEGAQSIVRGVGQARGRTLGGVQCKCADPETRASAPAVGIQRLTTPPCKATAQTQL